MKYQKATFGAGCFWHVEYAFSKAPGVISTTVGYMGGKTKSPTYKEVCTDKTGHAEVVQVIFDTRKIDYKKLIEVFWKIHDPTQLNKQGPDVGTQYRSVIFYHNEKQKTDAIKSKNKEQEKLTKLIVTEIKKAGRFYKAEEYHQKYLEKRGLEMCSV